MDKGRRLRDAGHPGAPDPLGTPRGGRVRRPVRRHPTTAAVHLEENSLLGTLGVNLANGVITPAIAKISPQIGSHLSSLTSPASKGNPVLASRVADPIALTTGTYRPLPDHSALGLSAFYIALLGLIAGFVGATLINCAVDSAPGYATSQLGPWFIQRRPMPIDRTQTFLVKFAIVAAADLTHRHRPAGHGRLSRHVRPRRPAALGFADPRRLMIATGTLALLAIFGSIGQLLATLLLSICRSPPPAERSRSRRSQDSSNRRARRATRNTLMGTRAILYFGARGDAGLTAPSPSWPASSLLGRARTLPRAGTTAGGSTACRRT